MTQKIWVATQVSCVVTHNTQVGAFQTWVRRATGSRSELSTSRYIRIGMEKGNFVSPMAVASSQTRAFSNRELSSAPDSSWSYLWFLFHAHNAMSASFPHTVQLLFEAVKKQKLFSAHLCIFLDMLQLWRFVLFGTFWLSLVRLKHQIWRTLNTLCSCFPSAGGQRSLADCSSWWFTLYLSSRKVWLCVFRVLALHWRQMEAKCLHFCPPMDNLWMCRGETSACLKVTGWKLLFW